MGIITNGLERIANSKIGTKFFKWSNTPKGKNFLDNTLPTAQTFCATTAYTLAVEKQDLDRRRKNLLHIQNWTPCVVGMAIGSYLNRQVSKFGDKVIQHLDPKQIPKMHKIVASTKMLLPMCTTMVLMRLVLPVATSLLSSEIEEYKARHKHIDTQA